MLLNPVLYAALTQLYGEVKVVKPGDHGDPPRILKDPRTGKQFARWLDGSNKGEEYQCCCPFCGDTGFHLYVNHNYGTRDCCGGTIRFANCFKGCLDDRNAENRASLSKDIQSAIHGGIRRETVAKIQRREAPVVITECRQLQGVTPLANLPESHIAVSYLMKRGYSRRDFENYSLGYCDSDNDFMASKRIIIPIFYEGSPAGWQARKVDPDARGPKYFTAPGCPVGSLLYNYDIARRQPFVVLTEGVTDVWRVGAPAVCLFGKALSGGQKTLLLNTWRSKPILIMLDRDAMRENEKVFKELRSIHDGPVHEVCIPEQYGDPGDTPPEVLRFLIEGALHV